MRGPVCEAIGTKLARGILFSVRTILYLHSREIITLLSSSLPHSHQLFLSAYFFHLQIISLSPNPFPYRLHNSFQLLLVGGAWAVYFVQWPEQKVHALFL